jgi:dihydroorotase
MPEQRILLTNARVVDPAAGRDEVQDVLVEGTTIAEVGAGLAAGGAEAFDCGGLILAPGLVDLHTHLREPGREDKETVESGSRAAAAGGFTAVSPMANTDPVADNAAVIHEVRRLRGRAGWSTCSRWAPSPGARRRGDGRDRRDGRGRRADVLDDGRCVPSARCCGTPCTTRGPSRT